MRLPSRSGFQFSSAFHRLAGTTQIVRAGEAACSLPGGSVTTKWLTSLDASTVTWDGHGHYLAGGPPQREQCRFQLQSALLSGVVGLPDAALNFSTYELGKRPISEHSLRSDFLESLETVRARFEQHDLVATFPAGAFNLVTSLFFQSLIEFPRAQNWHELLNPQHLEVWC